MKNYAMGTTILLSAFNSNNFANASQVAMANAIDLLQRHLNRLYSSPTEMLLLDGGTGEELFSRGVPDDRKIWSATAIVNEQYHSVVEEVHKSYIAAGSHAITTNSYGITPSVGFKDGDEMKRLVGIAGSIARKAVTTSSLTPSALVLGSLGPLVESYRPDLIMNHIDGVVAYQNAVLGLYPYVDVYLAETMSCIEEACQAIDAISTTYQSFKDPSMIKHPLLVSFTLNEDGNLRDGEVVIKAIPTLVEYARRKKVTLLGVLFNCCEPESISKAIEEIRRDVSIQQYLQHPSFELSSSTTTWGDTSSPKILLGAYANRLTAVDPKWTLESSNGAQPMRDDLPPCRYSDEFVKVWRSNNQSGGVQLVGGCCGIGPSHIANLRDCMK